MLRFLAIAGRQESISLLLEVLVHDAAYAVLVLDQQSGGGGAGPAGGCNGAMALHIAHLAKGGQPRQQDFECRAQANLAADVDVAAALGDDAVHHG